MRIVFVGAVEFSLRCLEELLRMDAGVVGVVTPAAERARFNSDFADLGPVAEAHGVPVHRIERINDPSTVALLRSLEPDLIFVFGFSQLVSPDVLGIPRIGCVGTHPALLPRNRGRHPLVWALVEGLEESGLTFFWLDEGADSGDILWQRAFRIEPEDDAASLYRKIGELAVQGIREFVPLLERGVVPRTPQDHSLATYWRKRGRDDGEIRWAEPGLRSHNLVRGLTRPYVGAHTYVDGRPLQVWKSRVLPAEDGEASWAAAAPGEVVAVREGHPVVRTGDGFLELLEWETSPDHELTPGIRLGHAERQS